MWKWFKFKSIWLLIFISSPDFPYPGNGVLLQGYIRSNRQSALRNFLNAPHVKMRVVFFCCFLFFCFFCIPSAKHCAGHLVTSHLSLLTSQWTEHFTIAILQMKKGSYGFYLTLNSEFFLHQGLFTFINDFQ